MADIAPAETRAETPERRGIMQFLEELFGRTGSGKIPEAEPGVEAISTDEVRALIRFVAERGGVPSEPELLEALSILVDEYDSLNPRPPMSFRRRIKTRLSETVRPELAEKRAQLITKYASLCEYAYEKYRVNGRSIIDSARASDRAVFEAFIWGVVFLILAIGPDIVFYMFNDSSAFFPIVSGLVHFSAFFWGGVGSAVFLLKTFSEIAADSRFDQRKLQGIAVRVFLGAAMAYIVVEVFGLANALGETTIEGMPFELTAAALAFLTGLGVRAFYGAFEALVDGIHDWFAKPRRNRERRSQ